MDIKDDAQHLVDEAKGKTKEFVGDATDNESLQAEGVRDQTEADLKQSVERVKDSFSK